MREYVKFYIDGQWVDPVEMKTLDVINPANEAVCGKIALGSATDVDKAVAAAKKAFKTWSQTTREERLDVLNRILAEYQKRFGDLAVAVTEEMGAPASLAQRAQVPIGMGHLSTAINVLKDFKLAAEPDRLQGGARHRDRLHHGAEALGSCALLRAHLRRDHACRRRAGWRV